MTKETPISVYCTMTHKLLARVDQQGIYLWCKVCRTEHYTRWSEMGVLENPSIVRVGCRLEIADRTEP